MVTWSSAKALAGIAIATAATTPINRVLGMDIALRLFCSEGVTPYTALGRACLDPRGRMPEKFRLVKTCAARAGTPTIPDVHAHQTVTEQTLPLRPQDEVECRRCGVHCDKVVYPAACLERSCPFVYAYEEFGHTYIGCMQKVYEVEIDLD